MNAITPMTEYRRQDMRPIWTQFRFPRPGDPPDPWFRVWQAVAWMVLWLVR